MKYTIDEEVWKDVKGYEGYYQVSNLGRVKSVNRIIQRRTGSVHTVKGRILKQKENHNKSSLGVKFVSLWKNNHGTMRAVHRLVAQVFLSDWDPNLEVDHIDRNRDHNMASNLRMVDRLQNELNNAKKTDRHYTSKYIGVYKYAKSNKWMAYARVNKVMNNLGLYDSEEQAARARDEFVSKLPYKDFYVLNFPEKVV
ncbi:MAG: NUMOD4 motif-containing HNH endonuclease [Sporolactobacillus sp.]